jgi:ligand-binding sensor domain-containing protein
MKNSNSTARRRVAAIFVIVAVVIASQNFNIHAASMSGSTFTSANRTITIMAGDDRYLWAGTCGEGLLRIDKSSGETVLYASSNSGLNGSCIRALVFDKDGALLVGTAEGGIVRFNGAKWERLSGLADSNVRGITVDSQGAIWAWMQNLGIVRLNAGTWQPVVNRFSGILTTNPAGNVWIMNFPTEGSSGCSDAWIHEYVNGGLQSSISLESICPELSYQRSLAVDSKKNCWIGVIDKLIKVTGQSIHTYIANTDTACRIYCSALAVNSYDVLLIAAKTYVSGLFAATKIFLYDQRNGNGNPFDSAVLTYSDRYIDAVGCADDRDGCFWLAASNGSIVRIDTSRHVTTFPNGNSVLPSNSIASLLIDTSDNVWVATNNGIARCADTSWTVYPAPGDTFPGKDACCLAMDSSGIIWAGFQQPLISSMSSTGLSYFNGRIWRMLFRSHFSQKAIAVDTTGDQWVVAEDGIYRYHEMQAEKVYTISSTSGYDTSMNAIAFDGNNIPWIGTDQGLKKYENGVWIDDTTINRLFPNNGASTMVNTLCFSNGTAWIGTACGLIKCTGSACVLIDTAGGILPDPYVQCIAVDGPDSAWIGTKRGLARLAGQDHATYTTENTPLCDNDITTCAAAPSGDVWIGTRLGGLTVLRQSATAAIPGVVSKATPGMQPIDISVHTLRPHTCRVSIRTNTPAALGFSVISLQGKLIKRFAATPAKVQTVTFTWNGTDRSNQTVANGMYLGIVTVNGTIVKTTVLPRRL